MHKSCEDQKTSSFEDFEIHIAVNANLDQRVYNRPSADQVAAIWVKGNNSNIPFERDIIVHAHSGTRYRVKYHFGCYDPLQYPLLFSNREVGWHQHIKKVILNDANENEETIGDIPSFRLVEQIFEGDF